MSDLINRIREKAQLYNRDKSGQKFNRRFTDQVAANNDEDISEQRERVLRQMAHAKLSVEDTVLLAAQEKEYDIPAYLRRSNGYMAGLNVDMTAEEHQYFFDFMKQPLDKDA